MTERRCLEMLSVNIATSTDLCQVRVNRGGCMALHSSVNSSTSDVLYRNIICMTDCSAALCGNTECKPKLYVPIILMA